MRAVARLRIDQVGIRDVRTQIDAARLGLAVAGLRRATVAFEDDLLNRGERTVERGASAGTGLHRVLVGLASAALHRGIHLLPGAPADDAPGPAPIAGAPVDGFCEVIVPAAFGCAGASLDAWSVGAAHAVANMRLKTTRAYGVRVDELLTRT